jgi:hypothetical protein
MALPLKTTADDARGIVRYLKTKPTGATTAEIKAVDSKLVDARKLSAFRTWGLVVSEGGRFKLTERAWIMARQPDREQEVFRQVADSVTAYRTVLEWIAFNGMEAVSSTDVGARWHEHNQDAVAGATDHTLRDNAVCFFNVLEVAGLGKLVLGRGGQPTRLNVDVPAVKAHIEAGPSAPPWTDEEVVDEEAADELPVESGDELGVSTPTPPVTPDVPESIRVFISHGKNDAIVEQIETMLGLADISSEVAEEEETTAIPVPDKVLNAMRRCQAGIIAVTVETNRTDQDGEYVMNENVLIEIGAAFVLYDRRVVLVWDKRLKVPSNLQGLYRCEFEGDDLSWSEGMKLMKAIQGFKKPRPSGDA